MRSLGVPGAAISTPVSGSILCPLIVTQYDRSFREDFHSRRGGAAL